MNRLHWLHLLWVATYALTAWPAGAQSLAGARYTTPVERYGHFALGRPHEYASLAVTVRNGEAMTMNLPDDEVFEDVAPRVVKMAVDESDNLLVIISNRNSGARLALVQPVAGRLKIIAQSNPIGIPMRWLNPVGVADLDGDGRSEIAAVITPHIGGVLKVYREVGERLVEIASLDGFSNHTYGSPEQALAAVVSVGGQKQLLVPDFARRSLRVIALEGTRLVETGRCPLADPVTGPVEQVSEHVVSVVASAGKRLVDLRACRR